MRKYVEVELFIGEQSQGKCAMIVGEAVDMLEEHEGGFDECFHITFLNMTDEEFSKLPEFKSTQMELNHHADLCLSYLRRRMVEMTNDVLIAKKLGYYVELGANAGGEDCWIITKDDPEEELVFWIECPPFDSAPTAGTDQIILEWVQGQDVFDKWEARLRNKLLHRKGMADKFERPYSWLYFFLENYKPGDYAKALLAMLEGA